MPRSNWLHRVLSPIPRHLVFTVGGGLVVAALFSLVALVIYIRAGSVPFRDLGASLPLAALGYVLMGVGAGLVAGILWPLARWWPGALVVGYVTAFPFWFLGGLVWGGQPIRATLHMSLLLALAFGPPLGFYVWWLTVKQRRP